MQQSMILGAVPAGTIELGIEDLETLEAPSWLTGLAGVLAGVGVGLIVVGIAT